MSASAYRRTGYALLSRHRRQLPHPLAPGKFADANPPAGRGIRPHRGSSGAHAGKSVLRVTDGPGQRGAGPGRPSSTWVTSGPQGAGYAQVLPGSQVARRLNFGPEPLDGPTSPAGAATRA
jgi:hypothetical protein